MKKKKLFVGILLASAVFSLAACGNGTGTTTTSDTTPVTSDTTPETTPTTPDTPVVENYKVNFYSNGGSAIESKTVKDGEKITTIPVPTRSGAVNTYTFEGWYTDVALTKKFDFEAPIKSDVTLYAKWTSVLKDATKITMNGKEYATIKDAIAAIPTSGDTSTYTIILPKGTYTENGLEYNGSATIKIVGATNAKYGEDVIIKGHGSDMTAEKTRNLIGIQGTGDIILENVTLVSDWGREGHGSNTQAEVLGTDTKGNTICYNCGFKSNQDTLRTAGKAWFYGCYIEGDVDFIWMEQAGSVALYENCEIVSVYDATASSHASYVTAPRMAISSKAGKGLVIYNSTVKESEEAKANGQTTYLGRSPWTSGYFSQVAYINTKCEDIEASVWYKNPIPSEYDRTVIGWKMDQATAKSLNYTGTDILDDATVETEFSGRRTILNRIYNCGKLKYEKDTAEWDIDAAILENGWEVAMDTSSTTLEGETAGEPTTYKFDGSQDVTSMVQDFVAHSSGSYQSKAIGATITVPVSGKCYVEVYGFYAGTVEAKADTQGESVMFFNNGSTSAEVINTYTVYDAAAKNVVITAAATTYITKIVVTPDTGIENVAVSDLTISASTKLECVGVPLKLTANVTPANATNKSIKWTSSAPEVAEIDEYTGKVTFKAAGEVTFTATARDGSGKSATITCKPVNPTWTEAEWYTTDATLDAETGAQEIGNFDTTTSEKCSLNAKSTFANIAGETIETTSGIKFNSKGKVNVSTTKGNATLTVVVARRISKGAFLSTIAPSVYDSSNPNVKATLISTEGADVNTDVEGSLITYTYVLPTAATWTIERGDGNVECSPLVYAKCVYETRITKSTFVNYKGGTYKATDGSIALNHNNDVDGSKVDSVDEITFDNVTYKGVKSNGNDNWLNFAQNGTIKFTVADACELGIYFYQGSNTATVTLNGVEVTCSTASAAENEKYIYSLSGAGEIVITAASSGYIGAFEVLYPSVDNSIKEDTGLVFHGDTITGMTNVKKWANNTAAGEQDGFTITGSNFSNGGYLEFKNDDKIEFDIKVESGKKAVITISSYSDVASTVKLGETDLTVTKDETNSSNQNYLYVAEATADGKISISATSAQNYLNWITIEFVTA